VVILHRWRTQGAYSPEISALWNEPMISTFKGMTEWQRAAAMELYYGVIYKHDFIVTHPSRRKADDLFSIDRLPDSIPMRSPDINIEHEIKGRSLTLCNSLQQAPISVTFNRSLPILLFKEINEKVTVNEIIRKLCKDSINNELQQQCLQIIRILYLSDIIHLRIDS